MAGRTNWLLLAAALVAPGCTGSTYPEVSGRVTVDGAPAKTGAITFIPVDGQSPTAGAEIVDGMYTANVPPGTAKVQIRVSKKVGEQKLYDTPDSPVQPIMQEVLPAKYNDQTELVLDVKPGTNEKNYDLETK
jgi:hypothetical protein